MSAPPPPDSADLRLQEPAGLVELRRDAVLEAARSLPTAGPDRRSVRVRGREVPVLELVALATGRPTTEIPLRRAVEALERLGFRADAQAPAGAGGRRSEASGRRRTGPARGGIGAGQAVEGDEAPQPPPLDLEAAKALRRYAGQWVALRDRRVVASGPTLHDVVTRSGASEAEPVTVLQVPIARDAP